MLLACRNFLIGLDICLKTSTVYEDNTAVMDMIKSDGPFSLRTRHLGIKLFFTKQYVDSKDIVVKYCRTDAMLADIFTKSLIGVKFRLLRDAIMVGANSGDEHA